MSYQENIKKIENHYQNKAKIDFVKDEAKPNYYVVPMFPYPSGNIHMGHIRNYTISNSYARYKKNKGFNVLHPIGFDSFGLPAELASIKHGVSPSAWTESNISTMIADFKNVGFDFDWNHIVKTHEFEYYKFEQDIFKRAYAEGLIYKKEQYVNYDSIDNTVLSNEQVVNGKSWRSGADVIKKKIPMYYFNMKHYAKELLDGLDTLKEWPKKVIEMQKNWINIEKGNHIDIAFNGRDLKVFHSENISNPNIVVVGINHPFTVFLSNRSDFNGWLSEVSKGSISQKDNYKEINYFNTGFAVGVKGVVMNIVIDMNMDDEAVMTYKKGFVKLPYQEVSNAITYTEGESVGLKDWCISRQRYWGSPIPMVECDSCGDVPSDDYVKLPTDLTPNGVGNVLDTCVEFVKCSCPKCGMVAKRSTDTMDTFMQSSWYYQRYIDPKSTAIIPNGDIQVDNYVGGVEHATMHLIYTRFFHKMLRDFGYINTDEPIKKLITQGMVCKKYTKPDGTIASSKMSKSLGNVVAPQEYIDKYGADALQMFIIFAAPPTENFDFEDAGIVGSYRFLEDVYRYFFEGSTSIKNQTQDQTLTVIEKMKGYIEKEFEGRGNLNTIIPQLMIALKQIKRTDFIDSHVKKEIEDDFVKSLGIFSPHLAEYVMDFVISPKMTSKIQM